MNRENNSTTAELQKIILFVIVGVLASASYFVTLAVCIEGLGISVFPAALVSFLLGTLVSYLGNTRFTFSTAQTPTIAGRFLTVVLAGLILNQVIAYGFDRAGFHYAWIAVAVFIAVPAFNYAGHRFWTYRNALAR